MSTEDLLAHVLRLPRQERARLAKELLSSLEEPDDEEVAAAWTHELERRSREVAEGKVQTVDWDTAQTEALHNDYAMGVARRDLMAPDTEPTDEELEIVMREACELALSRKAASKEWMRKQLAEAVREAQERSRLAGY